MMPGFAHMLHQTLFGAIAASGFGILFNFSWRQLCWCAASGALALGTRALCLDFGWPLEVSSFVAAATVGCCVRLLKGYLGFTGNALAVAGCIPMVPGSFAAQAIFGLFALSAHSAQPAVMALVSIEYMLRVVFTIGAIGTGLSITTHLLRTRDF
jgi:uncharacterized membrane protein YjjB (DUF3815 family)